MTVRPISFKGYHFARILRTYGVVRIRVIFGKKPKIIFFGIFLFLQTILFQQLLLVISIIYSFHNIICTPV